MEHGNKQQNYQNSFQSLSSLTNISLQRLRSELNKTKKNMSYMGNLYNRTDGSSVHYTLFFLRFFITSFYTFFVY